MARASLDLVRTLRQTAQRLEASDVVYQWSHFAHCNCGHVVQSLTGLTPSEIKRAAFERPGDWAEQAAAFEWPDYGDRPALDEGAWEPENIGACPATGVRMDLIFVALSAAGLNAEDIRNLERLSDPRVRQRMGSSLIDFHHADRNNVIAYLYTWADVLEDELNERARSSNTETIVRGESACASGESRDSATATVDLERDVTQRPNPAVAAE